MEVSGHKGSSDSIISCQPCQGDGDTVQAEGYCKNCNEFICSSCIKGHQKYAGTKNHVIESKDEKSTFMSTRNAPCAELCEVHKNELVKFYCQQHDKVGCGDCMVLEHTACHVQLVSDVSCNYDNQDELVLVKHRIGNIKKNLNSCKREIECSLKIADRMKNNIIKEIKLFRKEMDAYLDKVERDIIQEVEKVSAGDVSRQRKLQDQCLTTIKDIENMQRKLELCKDNVNNLFVSSKLIQKQLQSCQEIGEEISSKSQINTFEFTPAEDLQVFKVQNTHLGNLDTQVKKISGQCGKSIIDMKTHFVRTVNMKGRKEANCYITGMTIISEAEILCADFRNTALKVFNHKENKITSTLKTSSPPVDVTAINSSFAATTLFSGGKILFLITENGLTISHSIKVRNGCSGIDHHNGIMAVTFLDPPAIQVINMEGHILHKVKDTSILKSPLYVCLSNDNESMFVSDWDSIWVYEFTLEGLLKNIIESEVMKKSAGMKVTNQGSVAVCNPNNSDKVGIIVPGTRDILPLFVQNMQAPYSILICEEQRKMFIGEYFNSKDANYIKVFDLN